MQWNSELKLKLKRISALILVFLLVLATNMIDNTHFSFVKDSLATVYEDRLVAKNYIFKISAQLKQKQMAYFRGDSVDLMEINKVANDSIQSLINKYSQTKLTVREEKSFKKLENNLKELYSFENKLKSGPYNPEVAIKNAAPIYDELTQNLATLADIQIKEGKRQIDLSNRVIANSDLISKIEIGALIAIGLLIQILIFFRPSRG